MSYWYKLKIIKIWINKICAADRMTIFKLAPESTDWVTLITKFIISSVFPDIFTSVYSININNYFNLKVFFVIIDQIVIVQFLLNLIIEDIRFNIFINKWLKFCLWKYITFKSLKLCYLYWWSICKHFK